MITGGAGFIGGRLSHRLGAAGHRVFVLDDLSSGHEHNLPQDVEFLCGDAAEARTYKELPSDFDVVFHLASRVGQEASFEDPVEDLRSNLLATAALITWMQKSSVRRLVFSSSMNVYGNANSPDLALSEDAILQPLSPYAIGKSASENLMQIYAQSSLECVTLRLFNVYGPGQDLLNMRQGMVSIFMKYVLDDAPILVKGELNRSRDFIHVDDVVDAFSLSMRRLPTGTYNVATGVATTVQELLGHILIAAGKDPRTYPVTTAEATRNDQFGVSGDSTLLRSFGWFPKWDLREGIVDTVQRERDSLFPGTKS